MNSNDYIALLPHLILGGGAILLLLSIAVKRSHSFTGIFALIIIAASFVSLFFSSAMAPVEINRLLFIDHFSLLFSGMILFATALILLISYPYIQKRAEDIEEYYILLLLAALGSLILVSSLHFMSFFLGLELLSTSLYVLIAFLRDREHSIEAGIKYLILAASSSALILFGLALIYAAYGSMYFPALETKLTDSGPGLISYGGFAFILAGLGFKLALVPFHLWTPDVYEGAPAPVSALVATVSKAAVFAFLLRFISSTGSFSSTSILFFLAILSAASMLAGNILALLERNLKKILAYSSIAHLGYLLVAFLNAGEMAFEASAFYLAAYIITITGAFAVVSFLSEEDRDTGDINALRGLFWRMPGIAGVFTIILFSLAGLPLTAGFISKFYVLMAGVGNGLWWLAVILVAGSTIGLFYYLRIIVAMFSKQEPAAGKETKTLPSVPEGIVLYASAILLIIIGVFPGLLLRLVSMIGG